MQGIFVRIIGDLATRQFRLVLYYCLRTAGGVVCSAGTAGRRDRWSLRRKCMQIRLASCVIITQSCRSRPSMDGGKFFVVLVQQTSF